MEIADNSVFEIPYPFCRANTAGEENQYTGFAVGNWIPGIRFEPVSPDDSEAVADGLGKQVLTVVSVHKPGKFPVRIFYTRQWEDPDGKRFGKGRLRMTVIWNFRLLMRGYRFPFYVGKIQHKGATEIAREELYKLLKTNAPAKLVDEGA